MAYATTTLATLRTRLQERWDSSPFWSNTDALDALNEALSLWNVLTGTWRKKVDVTLTAGDAYWPVPGTLVYPMRLAYNNVPIVKVSMIELDASMNGWEGQAIGDTGIPTSVKVWCPVSLGLIAIWPHLTSGTGTLTIDGIATTPVLSADGDYVDMNESHLHALLGEALYIASFKAGAATKKLLMPLHQAFLKAAAEENGTLLRSQIFKQALQIQPDRGVTSLS